MESDRMEPVRAAAHIGLRRMVLRLRDLDAIVA
jgi:hypothetical protein